MVRLANNDSHYVAFKIKTTSPKKYCVRPTVGIVHPHGTCDFTGIYYALLLFNYRNMSQLMINVVLLLLLVGLEVVTMQAQRTAPPDFNCKDKFLVQSAVVAAGTTEDDISSDLVSHVYYIMLFSLSCLSCGLVTH